MTNSNFWSSVAQIEGVDSCSSSGKSVNDNNFVSYRGRGEVNIFGQKSSACPNGMLYCPKANMITQYERCNQLGVKLCEVEIS